MVLRPVFKLGDDGFNSRGARFFNTTKPAERGAWIGC